MPPAYVESLPTPEQRNGSQSERLRYIGRIVTYQVHTHFVTANATWDLRTKSWLALTEFEPSRRREGRGQSARLL